MESRERLRAAVAMEMLKIHIILLKRGIVLVVNGKLFGAHHILKINFKDKWKSHKSFLSYCAEYLSETSSGTRLILSVDN